MINIKHASRMTLFNLTDYIHEFPSTYSSEGSILLHKDGVSSYYLIISQIVIDKIKQVAQRDPIVLFVERVRDVRVLISLWNGFKEYMIQICTYRIEGGLDSWEIVPIIDSMKPFMYSKWAVREVRWKPWNDVIVELEESVRVELECLDLGDSSAPVVEKCHLLDIWDEEMLWLDPVNLRLRITPVNEEMRGIIEKGMSERFFTIIKRGDCETYRVNGLSDLRKSVWKPDVVIKFEAGKMFIYRRNESTRVIECKDSIAKKYRGVTWTLLPMAESIDDEIMGKIEKKEVRLIRLRQIAMKSRIWYVIAESVKNMRYEERVVCEICDGYEICGGEQYFPRRVREDRYLCNQCQSIVSVYRIWVKEMRLKCFEILTDRGSDDLEDIKLRFRFRSHPKEKKMSEVKLDKDINLVKIEVTESGEVSDFLEYRCADDQIELERLRSLYIKRVMKYQKVCKLIERVIDVK